MDSQNVYNIRKENKVPERSLETGIFEQAQKGDLEALGVIYDQYFERIFKFVYFRTSHKETAEDITEAVFSKAFKALPTQDGGAGKFSAWLFQIARNAVIDHYRQKKVVIALEDLEHEPSYNTTVVDELATQHEHHMLLKGLDQLEPLQATVVKLRFLEDLSIKEIAAQLGKTQGNIRIIQFRALEQLRKHISKQQL